MKTTSELPTMKTHLQHLLTQVFKHCPKTRRIVGVRRDTPLARALFPLAGLLASLGVHEHWNSAKEMKYSRNLGRKDGIELMRTSAN